MTHLADSCGDKLPVTPDEATQILEKLGTVERFTVNGFTVDQSGRDTWIHAIGYPMSLLWEPDDLDQLRADLKTITEETDAIN